MCILRRLRDLLLYVRNLHCTLHRLAHARRDRVNGCVQTAEHRLKLAVEFLLALRVLLDFLLLLLLCININKYTDNLLGVSAPVAHDIA